MSRNARARALLVAFAVSALASGFAARRAEAQEARALTLGAALRAAMANNPALAGRVIDVDVAGARILAASGLDDFVVAGGATWMRARGPSVPVQPSPAGPYDAVDVSLSLVRPLSTGGSVGLRLDAPWVRAPSGAGVVEAYAPSAQLVLTQPLLRGRGYDIARAPIRAARAQRTVAEWRLAAAADQVALDVTRAYWELSYASGALALAEASLEAAQLQLRATEAQISVGRQPPSAGAEVEVSIGVRQDDALDTARLVAVRAAELARFLGLDRDGSASLRAVDAPGVTAAPEGDPVARAIARSAEIAAFRAQTTALGVDVDVARNALLPQLDVSAAAGPIGIAADASPALRALAGFTGYAVQTGVVFQEPIQRRAARGAREAAEAMVERGRADERDVQRRIVSAVAASSAALDAARKRVTVLEHAVGVAELDLEGEEARFQASRSTNFDVLRRQQALTEVRVRLLRARVDGAEAAAVIDAASDDILARHGLSLRPAREVPR